MMPLEFYWGHFVRAEKAALEGFFWTLDKNPIGWITSALMVFLILWPLEFLRPWKKTQRKLRPQLAVDVFYTFFNNNFMWVLFGSAILSTWILVSHDVLRLFGIRPPDLLVVPLDEVPMWARFLALYLFADLVEYLGHWASHNVTFLWRLHEVHHSSRELDIWNANRFHFGEFLWGSYVYYFATVLVGFPVEEVFLVSLLLAVANVYSHANINLPLGPLKYVLNNPQLHIWHHASTLHPRRNVNYGASLAIWDYLLGTAYRPRDVDHPRLGYVGDEKMPTSLWGQTVYPVKAIAGDCTQALRRLFGRMSRRAHRPTVPDVQQGDRLLADVVRPVTTRPLAVRQPEVPRSARRGV